MRNENRLVGRTRSAVRRALSLNPRARTASDRQWHAYRQDFPAHLQGRARPAAAGAPGCARQDLEGHARRFEERNYWKDYQRAYEHALEETSVADAPWHVVPDDDKPNARLFVSQIVIDALEDLPLEMPPPDAAREYELKAIRAELEKS